MVWGLMARESLVLDAEYYVSVAGIDHPVRGHDNVTRSFVVTTFFSGQYRPAAFRLRSVGFTARFILAPLDHRHGGRTPDDGPRTSGT